METQVQQVDAVLNRVRPAMHADGGGVEVVSAKAGVVSIKFRGTCIVCPSQSLTLRLGIEKTLKEHLAWVEKVVPVNPPAKDSTLNPPHGVF